MFLILSPYPFTEFHNYHYEIDILRKKLNCKVEIHDLSPIINKKMGKNLFLTKKAKVTKFTSFFQWKDKFNQLKKNNDLLVLNLLDISLKSLFLNFILKKSNVRILKISSSGVCEYTDKKYNLKINEFIKKLRIALTNLPAIIFFFKFKILNILNRCVRQNVIHLVSGNKNKQPPLTSDRIIKFHSYDYSKFILTKKKININLTKKSIVIYLDKPSPYFKSDLNLFGIKNDINANKWYSDLNLFFHKIEQMFYSKLIIIPHAKVKGITNPYYDKKFAVNHDLDAAPKLTMKSKFVISCVGSTALAYAVASYKPITLIYSDFDNKSLSLHKNRIYASKILGTSLINISKKFIKKNILRKVSVKKYDAYKYRYLTSKKLSNLKNYEIINNIIKEPNYLN